jgi:hypothetical protein
MPKELYLLIGAVIGLTGPLLTAWINNRFQLRSARENREHQEQKERREQLREKLEEAFQLLTKIRMDTRLEASDIMRTTGTEYFHEQRQKSNEDVFRLQMLSEVYFSQVREHVEALATYTNFFWTQHETVLSLQSKVTDDAAFKDDLKKASREIPELSRTINFQVLEARNGLRSVAASLSSAVIPAVNAS